MKKFIVPILTDEYKILIFIGKTEDLIKKTDSLVPNAKCEIRERIEGCRGCAWNNLPNYGHPFITIHSDLEPHELISTLFHESLHCMMYIAQYIGLDDKMGEFEAHGISAVGRMVLPKIMKLKKL